MAVGVLCLNYICPLAILKIYKFQNIIKKIIEKYYLNIQFKYNFGYIGQIMIKLYCILIYKTFLKHLVSPK